ncbi:MAG: hypothetical protein KF861_11210 [Planctomycetaceae bacterium]|nr:hypothetical protein [Planctomycetaceae bacterium]
MGEPPVAGYDDVFLSKFWKALTILMNNAQLSAATILSILMTAGTVAAAYPRLRHSTLVFAWGWSLAATAVWLAAAAGTGLSLGEELSRELAWFAALLICLSPPIAVLGARRPGAGAWTWFVIIPLWGVLGWPALIVWAMHQSASEITLETPQLVGFALVLLMGTGNYLGTRFWPSALSYAVAVCLLAVPFSAVSGSALTPPVARTAASLVMGAAALFAFWQSRRSSPNRDPLDRLWADYRDTYGIVWARRLQDRFNAVALQQNWPVRISAAGFDWRTNVETTAERVRITPQINQQMRWMLRRFVSPEWIDQRLGPESAQDLT